MGNESVKTLRPPEICSVDGAELKREVYVTKKGKLTQELSMIFTDSAHIIAPLPAIFQTNSRNIDNHLAMLDAHWEKLKREFKQIMAEADFYYLIKKNKDMPDKGVTTLFLDELAPALLNMDDLQVSAFDGKFIVPKSPLVATNERYRNFRRMPDITGIELDNFEKNIRNLATRFKKAKKSLEKGIFGKDDGDSDDDLQLVTGSDVNDDDSIWRGDEHKDDDKTWRGGLHKDNPEPWENQNDDEDLEETELDRLWTAYEYHVHDFVEAANDAWLHAARQIYNNEDVTVDERNLETMKTMMTDSVQAYNQFRAAMEEDGLGFEGTEGFALLEDEDKGVVKKMRQLISTASKSIQMKIIIGKSLAKNNNNGMEFGT